MSSLSNVGNITKPKGSTTESLSGYIHVCESKLKILGVLIVNITINLRLNGKQTSQMRKMSTEKIFNRLKQLETNVKQ